MLRNKDIIKIRDLVYTSTMEGGYCAAKPGTPLALLNNTVAQIIVPADDYNGNDTSLTSRESSLARLSIKPDSSGVERHSLEMGTISKHTAKLVANSLNYARNVINPLIVDILNGAEKAKLSNPTSGDLVKQVIPLSIADAYNDSMLDSLISRQTRLTSTSVPIPYKLATMLYMDMTYDLFKETIATGNGVLDTKVIALLETMTEDERKEVVTMGRLEEKLRSGDNSDLYTNHYPLFSYLFLLGVNSGRLSTVDATALTSGERLSLSEGLNYFGYQINQQLKGFEMDIANNVIVAYSNWNTVYVINPAYESWLADKGSVEALLGFMSLSTNLRPAARKQQELSTNPQRFQQLFTRNMTTLNAENRIKVNAMVDQVIIKETQEFILDEYSEDANLRKEMREKLQLLVRETPYNHAMDIDLHALRIVCKVLSETENDAYGILVDMRGYLIDNPEAKPAEAALVAAANLIGKWVASQMCIVNN